MEPDIDISLAMRTDLGVCLEKTHVELNPGTPFLSNWHIDVLSWKLRLFAEGKTKRLAICMPPRHLKSTIGSVALPAWILGRDPTAKLICASYGEDLAKDFSNQTRKLMASDCYTAAFPDVQLEKATDMHLRTVQGGYRYTTTVGGTITGKGADFIIVDDPMKFQDIGSESRREDVAQWVSNLPTRLNNPNEGGILLIAQRLHPDDVIGRILELGGWEVVSLPLVATQDEKHECGPNLFHHRKAGEYLHPARINQTRAKELEKELGKAAFQSQYQQNPLPLGSGFLDLGLLKRFTVPPTFEHVFFSVDVATVVDAGDYSVCTIWGYVEQHFYLLGVWRKQVSFPELKKALLDLDQQLHPSLIIIEAVGSGAALHQDLSERLGKYVIECHPRGNKAHRFEAATLLMEKGRVWIPNSAPWLETLFKELQAFPHGKHDDQVDSISQMLYRWERVIQCTRTRCNPCALREIPTNYSVAATTKIKITTIPNPYMPDLW
jgi:predicted phage terminase large subunit-like protein